MRLVFLGSPAAVLEPLSELAGHAAAHGHELVGVVSQPARPLGRGRTLTDPPVAAWARTAGVPVLQPERAGDDEFLAAFRAWRPDVAITAAYGQILTERFLAIPTRATINIHPSLLPRYRGATPVPAALFAGDPVTGVTILFTVKALDAGNVIVQEQVPVAVDETAGPLTERLFGIGARLLWPALDRLADRQFAGAPQDPTRVSHCRKIAKTDGLVDWSLPARDILNRWRALEPWPGTYTFQDGRRIALTSLGVGPHESLRPGACRLDRQDGSLVVGTGDGTLRVRRLKPAGGREVDGAAFWNGLKSKDDVRFDRGAEAAAGSAS